MHALMRPRIVIVVTLYALAAASTAASLYHFPRQMHMLESRGWGSTQTEEHGPDLVIEVKPGGPADGLLRVGDEIMALGGESIERSDFRMESAYARLTPGEPYRLTVRRDGRPHEFTLRADAAGARLTGSVVGYILYSLTFLLVGLGVFLLKPDDKHVLLLSLCLAALGEPWAIPYMYEWTPAWLRSLYCFDYVTKPLFAPLLLHLFLVFPRPLPLVVRRPRLELLLYLPMLALTTPVGLYMSALALYDAETFADFAAGHQSLIGSVQLVLLAYLAACLVALALQYRRGDVVSKRKLRIILAGCLFGFGPPVVFFSTRSLLTLAGAPPAQTIWFARLAPVVGSLPLLLPFSFAYAIARHQVMPVSLIVRRSVQYLLAKNALRVLLLLPVAGLLLSVALDPSRSVADVLLRNSTYFYALAVAAVALGLVFRRSLNEWVDRKFFREHYDQEKILRGLVDDIRGLDSIPEMSRHVSEQVERAVHPESVYLFYRGGRAGELSLTYTSGGARQELRIPEDSQLLRLVELQGGAQDFPFPPKTRLPQGEKDWLTSLGARLVVPMTGTDERLAGLFLLGGKKSEVPYTARDRELLESVASQIAVVYENVRLKEGAREDKRVRQEVLSRFEGRGVNLLKECPACGRCYDSTATRCDREGSELQLSLPVERTVEGRYRLERLIGRGGMGAVYEATHLGLRSRVAVKILSGRLFGDSAALARFAREARALARLGQHPNIVAVHDYGELQTEGAFLVMDFIEGESLAALLRRERKVEPARAAELFEQVLEGVGAAHRAGIVHRDLKPENILVSRGEGGGGARVRLLDFGLAKVLRAEGGEAQTMTTPGLVMGTFGYMPPEQLSGGEVDERSDLFSVAVCCAEALTGERPFSGRTPLELLSAMEREGFRLPGDAPELERLSEALRRALAAQPARRYATAEEMRSELIARLRACPPTPAPVEPALDADTVMLPDGVRRL
jgi:eukaryotic-like serine/threonine-protein kinase